MCIKYREYGLDGYQVIIEPNADQHSVFKASWCVCDDEGIQVEGMALDAETAEAEADAAIAQLLSTRG